MVMLRAYEKDEAEGGGIPALLHGENGSRQSRQSAQRLQPHAQPPGMGSAASSELPLHLAQSPHRRNVFNGVTGSTEHGVSWCVALPSRLRNIHMCGGHLIRPQAAHLFMDMLTRLMMTLLSTRSALRADRRPSQR